MILENSALPQFSPELWAQTLFLRLCRSLHQGQLSIAVDGTEYQFGQPSADSLSVKVEIKNRKAFLMLLLMGSNGAAEAYMDGLWTTNNLTGLIQLLLRNKSQLDAMETGFASISGLVNRCWHAFNRNSKTGSKRNIAAHYDLSNEFFRLFLDKDLMYSSAIYPSGKEDLDTASQIKLETICQKLDLSPQDHLLEIGAGWGGMAIYAAKNYGCKVTTTTISKEQYQEATSRVHAEGLEHLITVLEKDYRDLEGQFDKLVSIEMVEAVGHHYLETYFYTINRLLKPNGLCLIQAITIEDQRYKAALNSVDFIKRYIFPGSFIPCVSVLTNSAAQQSLRLFNLEDIGPSYALTLKHWSERFHAEITAVKSMGFDDRFIRMWSFYLSYCEGGFRERAISNAQLLFVKPENRRQQWLKHY